MKKFLSVVTPVETGVQEVFRELKTGFRVPPEGRQKPEAMSEEFRFDIFEALPG